MNAMKVMLQKAHQGEQRKGSTPQALGGKDP